MADARILPPAGHPDAPATGHWSGLRRRFRPGFIVWLTAMWCLLMGEITVANLVGGLLVAVAIVLLLPLPAMPVSGLHISYGKLAAYLVRWFADLVRASVKVGWLAVRPAAPPHTAIVTAPMRVDNELVLTFAVSLYNLQPGGTITDIDIANRMLTIHLLDADPSGGLERELANVARLEAAMIEIFERSV